MTWIGRNLSGTILIPLHFISHCIVYYVVFTVINMSEDTGYNTAYNTNTHETKACQRPILN